MQITSEPRPTRPEAVIQGIYAETANFYDEIRPSMGANAFGYKILYGPPRVEAPIVFLGINPGGDAKDFEKGKRIGEFGEHGGWPSECEYADSTWNLARALQIIFNPAFLKACTGLNANFFRSKSVKTWNSLPASVRKRAEQFSADRAKRILEVLSPRLIVTIGFGPLDKLHDKTSIIRDVLVNGDRSLIRSGSVFGRQTLALRHLSASRSTIRPSADEMILIRDHMTQYAVSP